MDCGSKESKVQKRGKKAGGNLSALSEEEELEFWEQVTDWPEEEWSLNFEEWKNSKSFFDNHLFTFHSFLLRF